MRYLALVISIGALWLGGCPAPVGFCNRASSAPPDREANGSAQLGRWVEGEFEPYAPGETLELVLGGQGSYMIQPAVALTTSAPTTETCLRVELDHRIDGTLRDRYIGNRSFIDTSVGTPGTLQSETVIDDVLGTEYRGQTAVISIRVWGDAIDARGEIELSFE